MLKTFFTGKKGQHPPFNLYFFLYWGRERVREKQNTAPRVQGGTARRTLVLDVDLVVLVRAAVAAVEEVRAEADRDVVVARVEVCGEGHGSDGEGTAHAVQFKVTQ